MQQEQHNVLKYIKAYSLQAKSNWLHIIEIIKDNLLQAKYHRQYVKSLKWNVNTYYIEKEIILINGMNRKKSKIEIDVEKQTQLHLIG